VKPQIAPSMFPATKLPEPDTPQRSNTSKRRAEPTKPMRKRSNTSDEFGYDELDEEELVKVACSDLEFDHIDNFANPVDALTRKNTTKNKSAPKPKTHSKASIASFSDNEREPAQLANGKWACNHACKDKKACKHFCCKEGMDKPPKKHTATKRTLEEDNARGEYNVSSQRPKTTQSKLQLTATKRKISSDIQELDLTQENKKQKANYAKNGPKDYRELHQLHKTIQRKDPPSTLHSVMHTKPAYCYSQGGEHNLSFMQQPNARLSVDPSDYSDIPMDDLDTHWDGMQPAAKQSDLHPTSSNGFLGFTGTAPVASRASDTFGDDDSLLGDAMVGLADSQTLQALDKVDDDIMQPLENALDLEYETGFYGDDYTLDLDGTAYDDVDSQLYEDAPTTPLASARNRPARKSRTPFDDSTSSAQPPKRDFKPAKAMLNGSELESLRKPKIAHSTTDHKTSDKMVENDIDVLDLLDTFEDESVKEDKTVSEQFKGLEPWFVQEFGDIVELADE
jgi:ATP-dependent DNA helicase HFM1/MER3